MNGPTTRPPHFIINNITFDQLKIPSKFSKHLEGKTCGMVSLMGPSGNTWHANLSQQNDGLYIVDGWAAFVRDHFLEKGDSLVFKYDGNLHFTVQIFDQSSCEKETAFSAECNQDLSIFDQHFGKKREREYASLLTNIVDCVPKKARSSLAHEATNINGQCEVADLLNGSEHSGSGLKNSITHALPLSEVCPNEDEFGRMSASEAEKIAQSYSSNFPHFTKVMKGFNVSGSYTLNVPYQFAMAHLPNCKVKLVLYNLKGESWTINSVPTTKVQTSHTFCGGWLSFVRDNKINVRDVCIFELVEKCELRVNILRVRQEPLDNKDSDLNGSSNRTSHKISGRLTKKVKGSDDGSQSINGKSGKAKGLRVKRGSSMMGCMSIKSEPEERIAAESFISNFPYFVKVMKKFNVSGSSTLKVPYQFSMEHLPSCKTKILLKNLKGECWTVNSVTTIKVQTLHSFCGGWIAFVRDNGIQMGDICIFELIGRCEMRVHVSRFGKNVIDFEYQTGNGSSNELANESC
ncbi:B3 DNA binding domain-containing protein [Artemisia annua]|uniref:B3 DNA binding domain-containing protein n=1 Tax=Artemisia annua TaxID=35608 RepID=A0A2U1MFS6_ARTAN|nr:B3 DNA binding domain-containing protein [Artemisia annua]